MELNETTLASYTLYALKFETKHSVTNLVQAKNIFP